MDSKRGTAGLKAFRSLVSNASAEATNNTTTNNNNKNKAGDKEAPGHHHHFHHHHHHDRPTASPLQRQARLRHPQSLQVLRPGRARGADNSGAEPAATTKRASAALKVPQGRADGPPGRPRRPPAGPGTRPRSLEPCPRSTCPPRGQCWPSRPSSRVLAGAGGGATGGEEEGGSLKSKWGEMKRKQAGTALMGQSLSQSVS